METKSVFTWQKKSRVKRKSGFVFLLPSFFGVLMFMLFPFGDTVRRSLMAGTEDGGYGLSVYRDILSNQAFRLASVNTIRFMAVSLPLLLLISFLFALLVYHFTRKQSFFKTVLMLPAAIPAASIVLLWRMMFCEDGIVNQLFCLNTDWIFGPESFFVLVFAYVWKNAGYQMLLWLAALYGISDELYESARVDGAGSLQRLFYITVPQVGQAFGMILFLAVVNSFKAFREAYIVSGAYPNERIYLLQHLFNHWYLNLDIQKMSAAAVLLAVIISVPIFLLCRNKADGV